METMNDLVHQPGHAEGSCASYVVEHNSDAEVLSRVPVNAVRIALEEVLVKVFDTGPTVNDTPKSSTTRLNLTPLDSCVNRQGTVGSS